MLFLLAQLAFSGYLNGQEMLFPKTPLRIHFDPEEYRGGSQNWDFDQDSLGILLVANNDGLLQFDGANWVSTRVPASTKIRAVHVDETNRVFVGGQGQIGFFNHSPSGFEFQSLLEHLNGPDRDISETWKIVPHENKLFFSTLDKVFVLEDTLFKKLNLPGLPQRMHELNSKLLIQIAKEGMYEIVQNDLTLIEGSTVMSQEIMGAVEQDDRLIFFSIDGLVYEQKAGSFSLLTSPLTDNIINVVTKLSNGDIAVGTQNNGLLILNDKLRLKRHFTEGEGISNRTVTALHEDQFNNLWVGLHNGIDYVELSSPLSIVTEQVGFEGTGYAAACWKGQTYLGTNNGLFVLEDDHYRLVEGSEGQVYNLSIIADRLILNHHRGAFLVSPQGLREIHPVGSWVFMPTPIPGRFVAGSYDGIRFFTMNEGKLTLDYKIEGLDESSRVMAFENDSVLWMTHGYKGAFRIVLNKALSEVKKIKRYGAEDGFPSNTLINVYNLGGAHVFTGENGLYTYNLSSDRFEPNTFLSSLLGEEHVSEMASTPEGDIYYIQDRKLGRLVQESVGTYRKETHIFNRINKYLSDDLEIISILDNRNILIGSKEAFIHFDPGAHFNINNQFDVVVGEVKVAKGDSIRYLMPQSDEKLKIAYKESVQIHFASPYFDGFEELVYSYRLSPLNDKWSDWSAENHREFNFLPSGKYTFEVKARNVYGLESEVRQLEFSVLDPWYATDVAIIGYGSMALLGFLFFSLFQRKKHNSEKEEIKRSKALAIKEKDQKITEIEEKSRHELDELRNEKLKTEIAHKNSQLTSVTTHLLQKNELIQEIKRKIEHTIESGLSKDELRRVVKTIDKNLSDDASWDQFAQHFDEVHGDFLKKLSNDINKLTPQETKLAAYLRMNMTSKEIAHLMNISVRGVELARYRLRKKLKLDRDQNLTDYLLQY